MWLGAFSCVGRQSTQLKFPSLTQLTRVVCIVWLSWMPWIHKMTYDGNNGEWYNWPYQSDWNPLNKVYLSKTVKDRPKVIGHRWTHKHEWRLKSRVEQLDYNHSGTSLTAGAIIMYHNNEICLVSLPEDMIFVALTPLSNLHRIQKEIQWIHWICKLEGEGGTIEIINHGHENYHILIYDGSPYCWRGSWEI